MGINSSIIQKTKKKALEIFTLEWDAKIKVSTFLPGTTNGGIKYKSPFGRVEYGAIWIEDGKGKGVGEWVEIDNSQTIDKMLFLNGVILPGSPASFIENGRIKKLQIDFDGFSQIAELVDTPNPQVVFWIERHVIQRSA